jgi:hypothetical protein
MVICETDKPKYYRSISVSSTLASASAINAVNGPSTRNSSSDGRGTRGGAIRAGLAATTLFV